MIASALTKFNADFFRRNNISFGGGSRIALEIDEYRESVDIDFICPDKDSYRAVREQVTGVSLGELVSEEFEYLKEIRTDRYAVRTFIRIDDTNIKLEIISCDEYRLSSDNNPELFPLPYLSRESCFITKLLANADRALIPPYKDIFDLVAMYIKWGDIPRCAWEEAERQLGSVAKRELIKALRHIMSEPKLYFSNAKDMKMKREWAKKIIQISSEKLLLSL